MNWQDILKLNPVAKTPIARLVGAAVVEAGTVRPEEDATLNKSSDVDKTKELLGSGSYNLHEIVDDLFNIHHKLDTLKSEAIIDYHAVDKVEEAVEILRKEIREMKHRVLE